MSFHLLFELSSTHRPLLAAPQVRLFAGVKGSMVIGIIFITIVSWIPGTAASYLGSSSPIAGALGHLRRCRDACRHCTFSGSTLGDGRLRAWRLAAPATRTRWQNLWLPAGLSPHGQQQQCQQQQAQQQQAQQQPACCPAGEPDRLSKSSKGSHLQAGRHGWRPSRMWWRSPRSA